MSKYLDLDALALMTMLAEQKLQLIDVRNDDEVARGIIQTASHLPLAMLPLKYEQLKHDTPIVFYCHSGVRSAQAASFLSSKGYTKLYNLQGGILAWARAGYTFVMPQKA